MNCKTQSSSLSTKDNIRGAIGNKINKYTDMLFVNDFPLSALNNEKLNRKLINNVRKR